MNTLRQELDDIVITHTGRSLGDLASQRVLNDFLDGIIKALPERYETVNKKLSGGFEHDVGYNTALRQIKQLLTDSKDK